MDCLCPFHPTYWRENQFPWSTINVATVITSSIVILAFALCHVYVGYALNDDDSDNESTPDSKAIPFKMVLACDDIQRASLNYQMTN